MLRNSRVYTAGLALVVAVAAVGYAVESHRRAPVVLTGVVTTNDVIVTPPLSGRVDRLLVVAGQPVTRDQLLAVIAPDPLPTERPALTPTPVSMSTSSGGDMQAELTLEDQQVQDEMRLASTSAEATEAEQLQADAQLDDARVTAERLDQYSQEGLVAAVQVDDAHTAVDAARARVEALSKEVQAQQKTLALAQSNEHRIEEKQTELLRDEQGKTEPGVNRTAGPSDLFAAGHVVREVRAPIDGVVDNRSVQEGDEVGPGEPVLTLINPNNLWVRADVSQGDIDRIHLGDRLPVRLSSGQALDGTVFYRSADNAGTFEIRVRVDNTDRDLAVGMQASIALP